MDSWDFIDPPTEEESVAAYAPDVMDVPTFRELVTAGVRWPYIAALLIAVLLWSLT